MIPRARYVRAMRALSIAAFAMSLAAGLPAAAQEVPFQATGEVRLLAFGGGSGAAFDESRLVGPTVNLTRRDDGTWGGDLAGVNVDLHLRGDDRLTGPNVNITYGRKGGTTKVEGLFHGRRVRVELGAKRFQARLGACSFDLTRKNAQTFVGDVGCSSPQRGLGASGKATLTLLGQAAAEDAPLPHLALALVALMPG